SFASGYLAIDQDKVDVLMSGLDITQKRRHSLNMVYYTGEKAKEYSLIFWDKIPSAITSIEDIQHIPDAIVCVEMGSLKESFLDKYRFITKKRMNSVVDMILDLCFGKSLAALADSRIARRLKMQNDQLQLLSVPLPPEHQVCGCGIAMNKNNTQCARSVARIVDDMIHDGTLKQLEVKWQLEE